jgi:hypothetical protein
MTPELPREPLNVSWQELQRATGCPVLVALLTNR